jgi:hypothetical protein
VGPLFLILWVLAQSQISIRMAGETDPQRKQIVAEHAQQSSPQPTPALRPGEMSMYSEYVPPQTDEEKFKVRCKTERSVNNVDIYIPIEAVAEEDVVGRAGKILIPAGTKVTGRGYCDPETGRILSRGKWTFYVSDHQITVEATLWDETGKEGMEGTQFSEGLDQQRIKQAIYRDGAYLYVPSQTEFTLELQGNITVQDLPSAFGK